MTNNIDFTAPTAYPLFYRTYSRYKADGTKESPQEAKDRSIKGLENFGLLTEEELELIRKYFYANQVFVSGRWFWVGGTEWVEKQKNYIGAYNCASVPVTNWDAFRFNFRALLMGCGVGTVVELDKIEQLPEIKYPINLVEVTELGTNWVEGNSENDDSCFTAYKIDEDTLGVIYTVGDSKEGWVDVATDLLEFSSTSLVGNDGWTVDFSYLPEEFNYKQVNLSIDLSYVRPAGIPLKGFGGLSNPEKLEEGLKDIIKILNKAVNKKLNSLEICKILGIHGVVTVAGNLRRSARVNQGSPTDEQFTTSKDNLWIQGEDGKWKIDPERDMLRFGNHTNVYHTKPDSQTIIDAVRKQYYSGEGAIQYAPEAIARGNADLLDTEDKKKSFLALYCDNRQLAKQYLEHLISELGLEVSDREIEHRLQRYNGNPCMEILGKSFLCCLSEVHLNVIDPHDIDLQVEAFKAAALSALPLLKHEFDVEEIQYSREIDPIIGVSFTGLFDFFANKFGSEWLKWWKTGRSREFFKAQYFLDSERACLELWKSSVKTTVEEFCKKHSIKQPNRYTTVQPAGCWNVDAVRVSDSGIFYMDELLETAKGIQPLDLTVRQGVPVKTGIANELLPTKKIILQNGRELITTLDHKLSVNSQWIKTEDLQVGDTLDTQLGEYSNNIEFPLIESTEKLNGRSKIWTAPTEMSPKLAYLLGVIDGNGCFSSSHRIRITHGDLGVLEYTSSLFLELFGFGGNIKKGNNHQANNHELCVASESISTWFKINDLDKRTKSKYLNRLHLAVRRSSKQSILAYFAGLIDTDGCIRKNGAMSIASASEDFLRNLQQVGECVGLCFKISHETKGTNFQGNKDMWSLNFLRMVSLEKAVDLLNFYSVKAKIRPIGKSFRQSKHSPFEITNIEDGEFEYTYDISIDSENDDNCWYWQGAIKSHNSKSLLTGASPGWHPPKDTRYIRRITYSKDSPVAQACADYGYKVIPSQSCKDDNGNLLDDINDPRVNEVLVEIPIEVSWADIADKANFKPKNISVLAQLDFYMQVQNYYSGHTTSATLELSEHEIEILGNAMYDLIQKDEGYISVALLAKFDSLETFPRLPFEPISQETYLKECQELLDRRINENFLELVNLHTTTIEFASESGSAGCDSDKCLLPEKR